MGSPRISSRKMISVMIDTTLNFRCSGINMDPKIGRLYNRTATWAPIILHRVSDTLPAVFIEKSSSWI